MTVIMQLPKDHKAIELTQAHGVVWCLVERPDGGSYWVNVSDAIEPTEH